MVADRQDIRILPEHIQHRIEEGARKNRRSQIAHAFRIDRIMVCTVLRTLTDADLQVILQALAHLGSRLSRDGQQLCLVIRGEIGGEACMLASNRVPCARRGSAA